MSNKLCSVMMSMILLLICSSIQSMKSQRGISEELEVRKQRFDLINAEQHGEKFQNVHDELVDRTYERQAVKSQFKNVMIELDWFEREPNQRPLDDLDMTRECEFLMLLKSIGIENQRNKEETEFYKNKFMAVLAELKRHENSEEEEIQDFHAWFEQEFAAQQTEKEVAIQEAAFEQLTQSLVCLESSQQEIPELFDQEEKAVEQVTVEAVTVGWGTWFKDKIWGASNLLSDLSSEKISLDVLKKSPDMQSRINYMIARHSLTPKTDVGTLTALVSIYTALDTLNFKFVDAEVNTALYNACKILLAEKRNKYTDTREARVLAIAKYLTSELNKMVAEEAPHAQTIVKLEELERLIRKVGMVEVSTEEKAPYVSESIVFEIVGNLEKLSLALTEDVKEEVTK